MDRTWGIVLDVSTLFAGLAAVTICCTILLRNPDPISAAHEDIVVSNWEEYAVGHRQGPPDAPILMIAWTDYQCQPCRGFHRALQSVLPDYPNEVAVLFRHWPLSWHQYAYPAARAAECAAAQGMFIPFQNRLFEEDNWLGDAFVRFAEEAGVGDLNRFVACLGNKDPVPVIERDIEAARKLGARGTPTVVVNGVYLGTSALDPGNLHAAIQEALGAARHPR